jgi:hypothetical protein
MDSDDAPKLAVSASTNALIRKIQEDYGDVDPKILKTLFNGHWPEKDGVFCERCGAMLMADSGGVVEECPDAVVREILES